MTKKIGNIKIETFPLSKCNLKATETMVIYPLKNRVKVCPICGQELHNNYVFAVQISKTECIKIYGSACYFCDAFFTRSSKIIDWLKIKSYNKGIPRIIYTYNKRIDLLRYNSIFNKAESIFRQYLLISEKDIMPVFVTFKIEDEDHEQHILHYLDPLANKLLKAEKDDKRRTNINDVDYVILRIKRKVIPDEKIQNDIDFALKNDIVISNELPPFSSTTTVYIYRGNLRCHSIHHEEEVRVIINDLSVNYRFYAEYCHECKKYLMNYNDYETYLNRYKLFPSKAEFLNNTVSYDEYDRAEKSFLFLNGYSVSKNAGLSVKERQDILTYVVDHGILEKRKVLNYLEEATRIANTSRDSTMAYVDHLLDQCAPIYYELRLVDKAIDTIQEAIQLCEENMEIASYRRLRFDAYLFLTQIYTNTGDYIKAEAIYDQLEPCRADSPYAFDESKPLCPQSIRNKAAEQRNQN